MHLESVYQGTAECIDSPYHRFLCPSNELPPSPNKTLDWAIDQSPQRLASPLAIRIYPISDK